ncbi:LuxR C-terminal-related transcriptional regulator [Gordonia bronchialis]|nr:LuxR C-terminal-related transcriptional regulator [Gordonia bronchialis]
MRRSPSGLFISTRTAQTHVSHALAKLGLRTRVELAAHVAGR